MKFKPSYSLLRENVRKFIMYTFIKVDRGTDRGTDREKNERMEDREGGRGRRKKMRLRISNSHIGREREKDWRTGLDG